MTPYFQKYGITLFHGDCREVLRGMADASVDSCITDPPYELGFMGKAWDASGIANSVDIWSEVLRVIKPGGHLLAFGGTRTYHRMACAIEDAGFEIRDSLHWIYGSGFPKSMNVQQAINKAARGCPQGGADPESPNHGKFKGGCSESNSSGRGFGAGAGAFMREQGNSRGDDAGPWQGWGTALKPAHEPIILARKPLVGTVAANVLEFGTGALNIDASRIAGAKTPAPVGQYGGSTIGPTGLRGIRDGSADQLGRWPANVLFAHLPDCTDEECAPGCAVAELDRQSGTLKSGSVNGDFVGRLKDSPSMGRKRAMINASTVHGDSGGASRFFYVAKPSRSERDAGCEHLPLGPSYMVENGSKTAATNGVVHERKTEHRNIHPTVKPLDLMRYLVRLVTPPGGLVLDPFTGSGTTACAAVIESLCFVGSEMTAEYLPIIEARVTHWAAERDGQLDLFKRGVA